MMTTSYSHPLTLSAADELPLFGARGGHPGTIGRRACSPGQDCTDRREEGEAGNERSQSAGFRGP